MELKKYQDELLFTLRMAAKRKYTNEIIYKSEWLGFLPYGQYHWIEIGGEELKPISPDSLKDDLSILCKLGLLIKVREIQNNKEDTHIYYELGAQETLNKSK